jgi:hypothetical protein
LLCIKTVYVNHGNFSNTVLVDISGINRNYGITSLASGINYRSDTLNIDPSSEGDTDSYGNSSEGYGNFTNRYRPDSRYLEDVMNNQSWSDICMKNANSGLVVGSACDRVLSDNPSHGYKRTFGNVQIIYNNDISDPLFKTIKYVNDEAVFVPDSEAYNNISPANPSIR